MMQLTMIVDQTPIIAESNRAIMQEEDEFYGMIHQARDEFLGKHEFQDSTCNGPGNWTMKAFSCFAT